MKQKCLSLYIVKNTLNLNLHYILRSKACKLNTWYLVLNKKFFFYKSNEVQNEKFTIRSWYVSFEIQIF